MCARYIINKTLIKKNREPQWSSDEKLCGLLIGANVLLYEDNNFDRYVHKISVAKVAKFSIAPGNAPYHVLCYMPGMLVFIILCNDMCAIYDININILLIVHDIVRY